MELKSFKRLNNGMYKIKIDNGLDLVIHEDLILKYELLYNKKITAKMLETLEQENKTYEVYNMALKYLKTKLRSQKEMNDYLIKKGYSADLIDNALTILKKQGYIDDERYAEAYINDQVNLTLNGPVKIKKELENKDIFVDDLLLNLFNFDMIDERINKLINRYLKSNTKSTYVFKQKVLLNLINLGYLKEDINRNLNKIMVDDKTNYKKEYDKIKRQLSKKYSGYELDYKIKQKMYQRGYSYERED